VLAVGDASFRQKSLNRIQSLIKEGTSILFVSHNLYMVQAVCQKSLYLKSGEVKLWDETKKVIEAYESDIHAERASKFSGSATKKEDSDTGMEITRIDVLGTDNRKPEQFLSNQPARIQVHYNAYRDMGKINMSLFVIRSDGLTCTMMRTKLDNFVLNVERGVGAVSVELEPLQLITGTYFVEAWFLNDADLIGLTPMGGRSDWFSVKGIARSYEESSGVYEPLGRWSHQHSDYVTSYEGSSSASPSLAEEYNEQAN
jgi:hypothetical protein